jgi:hypothetical protein
VSQLDQRGAAEELGVVDHGRAGDRHRPSRAEDRHRVEAHGDAGLGQHQREVHAEALLVQRRHRTDDGREHGPALELFLAAGQRLGHLEEAAGLPVLLDRDDDVVLLAAPHAGVELVQHARLDGAVLGADHGARGADVVERLHDLGAVLEVFLARRAHLAGGRVAVEDAAAVRADVDVLAVQRQVVLGVAGAERELVRHGAHRLLDGGGRDLRYRRLAIDRGAVGLKDVKGVLRVELDADVLDDVEGGFMDLAHVLGAEKLELDALADVALVCVCHGGSLDRKSVV